MSRQVDNHPGVARFIAGGQKLCSLIPCFGLLWGRVSSVKHGKVGTACVNAKFQILVDGDWAMTLPEKTLLFVAAHEVFHPILTHTERAIELGICDDKQRVRHGKHKQAEAWNVATDMVINAGLASIGLEVPTEGLLPPSDYAGELNAEAIWRAMGSDKLTDPPGYRGQGAGLPQPGSGCGMDPEGGAADSGEEGDAPDLAQVRAEVAMVVRGTSGGGVLARLLGPPQVKTEDWLRLLRGAYREAAARKGYDQTSYARPRRAGDALLPRYRSTQPSIGILVDTSGSMSGPLLDKIINQVFDLSRAYPAVRASLITFHSEVAWSGWVNGQTDRATIARACGHSGGTQFQPAVDRLEEMQGHVDVVAVFSDGYFESPWPKMPARKLVYADYSTPGHPGSTPPSNMRVTVVKCDPHAV